MKKETLLNILIHTYNIPEREANGLILSGKVLVNDVPVTKTGTKINSSSSIRIKYKDTYVSRAAHKLLSAFNHFKPDVHNKICIDVGASTGGFSQVLLTHGAKKVFAVDCGTNQLAYSIRMDKRVYAFENTNIKDLDGETLVEPVDFAVIDVSFTSALPIIKHLIDILHIYEMIVLIKPQFEYMRLKDPLGLTGDFNGIVHDSLHIEKILNHIKNEIEVLGISIIGIIPSSLKGTKGNQEYLFYLKGNA